MGEVRELIGEVKAKFGADEILLFIEAGAMVWIRLFAAVGAIVHLVDPKQAKRFGESLGSSGAKDDRRDAETLLELGRSDRHRPEPWAPPAEAEGRLMRLSARRERLVEERTRETQRLREDLRLSMPLVEDAIGEFEAKWVHRMLKLAPTPWHLSRAASEDLIQSLRGAREPTVARVREAIKRTEAPWLTESVAEDEARAVWQALERLQQLNQHIAADDEAIDSVLAAVPVAQQVLAVSGIGPQLAAALVVFGLLGTGDRDSASVRMGASPVFRGSGVRKDGRAKGAVVMRKSTASRARQSTYLLGRLAVRNHDWARRQYAAALERGKNAATAYRQVTRSFLRILFAMVRDGTTYDAARYERALVAHGVNRPVPAPRPTRKARKAKAVAGPAAASAAPPPPGLP